MEDIFKDYNYDGYYPCSPYLNSRHCTKLMYLIMNVKVIQNGKDVLRDYILNNKDEINKKNDEKWTALMIAVQNNRDFCILEEIKLLIKNGAVINEKNSFGDTALILATTKSKNHENLELELIELLLNNGADVNLQNNIGYSALIETIKNIPTENNLQVIKLLLDKGANVNLETHSGNTALILFAKEMVRNENKNYANTMRVIKILIEYGADLYIQNEIGEIFFNLLEADYLTEIIYFIVPINQHKLCMQRLIKSLPNHANSIIMLPGSMRTKLIEIRWCMTNNTTNNDLFTKLKPRFEKIFKEYGVYDNDSLKKVLEYLKFMD